MSYMFNTVIHTILFEELFNDTLYDWKWRLSLNLVCKRWYSLMAISISKSNTTVYIKTNSDKKQGDSFQHLLNRDKCILTNTTTIYIQPTYAHSLDIKKYESYLKLFEQLCQIAQYKHFIFELNSQVNDTVLYRMIEILNNSNSNNNSKTIAFRGVTYDIEDRLSEILHLIQVPLRFIPVFGISPFDIEMQLESVNNLILNNPHTESLNCYASNVLNDDSLPTPQNTTTTTTEISSESNSIFTSLKKFNYQAHHILSIDREITFISNCQNLRKLKFKYKGNTNALVDYIVSSSTLESVHLTLDFNDVTLKKILSNKNISKLVIEGTSDHQQEQQLISDDLVLSNNTLRTLQLESNGVIFDERMYRLFLNPNKYVKRLRYLKTTFTSQHENWLLNLSANDESIQSLQRLDLIIDDNSYILDGNLFNRFLNGNSNLKLLLINLKLQDISNFDSFVTSIDSTSALHTVHLNIDEKSSIKKSISNKSKHFIAYTPLLYGYQCFVRDNQTHVHKAVEGNIFSKIISFFK